MPRNWDPSQNLNNGRVEWPQGPLTDDKGQDFPTAGWTPRWLDAWVVQAANGAGAPAGGGVPHAAIGASQATHQSDESGPWAPGRWTADGMGWKSGTFYPRLAMGIALLAYKKGNDDAYDWWIDLVDLY
jgi:hypothetical protein